MNFKKVLSILTSFFISLSSMNFIGLKAITKQNDLKEILYMNFDDGNLQDGFGRVAGTGESRVWGYQPQKDNGHRSLTCPRNTKETENGCNRQAQKYTQVLRQGNTP